MAASMLAQCTDENMKQTLHGFVYQDENKLARKNAKVRLQYEIRGDVGDFIQEHIVGKGILADEYFKQREEVIKSVKNITDLKSECININNASLLQTAYINAENSEDSFTFNTNYTNEDSMRYFDFLLDVKPEIKSHYEMSHNLPKLIISDEFEVKDDYINDESISD